MAIDVYPDEPVQIAEPVTVDGTVSVTEPVSVDDNAGSLTVDNAALSVVGGGTEATALRVTVASDSTGLLSVDDNGGSLTVDAVNLDIRDLTFAADKVDASGTVLGAGTNNIGDVDVLSVVPGTGATNLGKAEDAVHTSGDVGVMDLGVINLALTTLAADGDYAPKALATDGATIVTPKTTAQTLGDGTSNSPQLVVGQTVSATSLPTQPVYGFVFNGTNWDRMRGDTTGLRIQQRNGVAQDNSGDDCTVKVAHLDMTSATTTDIVAAVASKRIRVLRYSVATTEPATATNVNFVSGAGTTRATGSTQFRLNDQCLFVAETAPTQAFLFQTVAGEALRVTQSGATDISISVTYIEVD